MSADGKFGDCSGQCAPKTLMPAIGELTGAYERYVLDNENGLIDDFHTRPWDFGGRPTPLQHVDRLSEHYDCEVYLKREDLFHDDARRLNNALEQILLAKYVDKERVIAEAGADQHGTATVTTCVHSDMPCEAHMSECDIGRQRPNVFRMKFNGSEVNSITVDHGTLEEAISEAMCSWAANVEDIHYVIGSVVGPRPFLNMIRGFQLVISEEAHAQAREKFDRLLDAVVACVGGSSNTMGAFVGFVNDEETALYVAEIDDSTLEVDREADVAPNSTSLTTGSRGTLHDVHTRFLQDHGGQIMGSHSVSSGLDCAGAGSELAHLADTGRVTTINVDDDATLAAFHRLSQMEGIIPALESAHAFGYLGSVVGPDAPDAENANDLDEYVMVNVSGRDDKDLESAIKETYERDIDITLSIDELTGGL